MHATFDSRGISLKPVKTLKGKKKREKNSKARQRNPYHCAGVGREQDVVGHDVARRLEPPK